MSNELGNQTKLEYFAKWLETPIEKREIKKQSHLAKKLRVSSSKLSLWKRQLQYNPLADRIQQVEDKLYELALQGKNPKYAELYLRSQGVLLDKSERKLTLELSADDYFRIRQDAERKVSETLGLNGNRGLLLASPLLSEELCEDTGQDNTEND